VQAGPVGPYDKQCRFESSSGQLLRGERHSGPIGGPVGPDPIEEVEIDDRQPRRTQPQAPAAVGLHREQDAVTGGVESAEQDAGAVGSVAVPVIKVVGRDGGDPYQVARVGGPHRVEPRVGRVRDPLAVAQQAGAIGGPGQAEQVQRQVGVQQPEVGAVRVGRGRLHTGFAPEVTQDLAAVRRPGRAGSPPRGSDPMLVRPIGVDRDAEVGKDLTEDDLPVGAGRDAALRRYTYRNEPQQGHPGDGSNQIVASRRPPSGFPEPADQRHHGDHHQHHAPSHAKAPSKAAVPADNCDPLGP